jgi:hypothetical protein
MANLSFSLFAAAVSLLIVIGAAVTGHWVVSGVWALLLLGFIARASESRWRGGRRG